MDTNTYDYIVVGAGSADAVVNDRLRVYGIKNLRVANASIIPTLTSGNTNTPSIMIGEKCAQLILAGTADPV